MLIINPDRSSNCKTYGQWDVGFNIMFALAFRILVTKVLKEDNYTGCTYR